MRTPLFVLALLLAATGCRGPDPTDEADDDGWFGGGDWWDDSPSDDSGGRDSGGRDSGGPDSGGPDSGSGGGDDGGEDTGTDGDVRFVIGWAPDGIEVLVHGCEECTAFGIVETDSGCASDPEYGCWTGEDCIYGYTSGDGSISLGPYCHPLSEGSAFLRYGASPYTLEEGEETVFTGPDFEGSTTFYAERGGTCWISGADTSYYAGLGCSRVEAVEG